ncbi:MAG: hypothetical protein CMF50_02890 [Legionellales bacterium]|nr:hypothetical protein [Legionellales bacterium]|tara:strand:+ start:51128 stop:51331 length:204 start_codon:yes stop_codon:yes gene_type:complete
MATHEIYQVDDFDDALLTDDINDNFVEADTMLKLDPLAKRRRIEELLESKKLRNMLADYLDDYNDDC